MYIENFANSPLNYTYNICLDLTETWSANTIALNLDYQPLWANVANGNTFSNVWVGDLSSNLGLSNINLPNPNNFSLTISANNFQTQQWMINSIDPNERILIIQTVFTSNTGNTVHANNLYLKLKNSGI